MCDVRLSIVTIGMNNERGLQRTLESVGGQDRACDELVVVDGGSKDRSIDVIRNHEAMITWWVSEADGGIYDAMNKGLDHCSGDFVFFLNSGDALRDAGVLDRIVSGISELDAVYYSRTLVKANDLQWVRPSLRIRGAAVESWTANHNPNHPSLLFPRSFYSTNRYRADYKVSGDTEYIQRLRQQDLRWRFIESISVAFEMGGASSWYGDGTALWRHLSDGLRSLRRDRRKALRRYLLIFRQFSKFALMRLLGAGYFAVVRSMRRVR